MLHEHFLVTIAPPVGALHGELSSWAAIQKDRTDRDRRKLSYLKARRLPTRCSLSLENLNERKRSKKYTERRLK
jgi:hypothetical protein